MATTGTTRRTVEYGGGTTFEGHISNSNGRKSGLGRLTLASGDEYCGHFESGYCDGLGILTFSNKSEYRGEFKDGKYNGFGVLTQGASTFKGKFAGGQISVGNLHTTVGRRVIDMPGMFSGATVSQLPEGNISEAISKADAAATAAEEATKDL